MVAALRVTLGLSEPKGGYRLFARVRSLLVASLIVALTACASAVASAASGWSPTCRYSVKGSNLGLSGTAVVFETPGQSAATFAQAKKLVPGAVSVSGIGSSAIRSSLWNIAASRVSEGHITAVAAPTANY